MKKYLTIFTALLVAGLFTAVNVSAYDYIYGGTRPENSFYFTDRGSAVGIDYNIGNYITGVENVVAGDVFQFDINISGVPDDDGSGGYLGSYWDLLYTDNLLETDYNMTHITDGVNNPMADWAEVVWNNPGNWIVEGYATYDSIETGKTGDIALMQIEMTADALFERKMVSGVADGVVDLAWHWSAGIDGDVVMIDLSYYNIFENGHDEATFAHHDLPLLGDCRLLINPVPVPAAIWLLGSGLLGILGIRRRSQK